MAVIPSKLEPQRTVSLPQKDPVEEGEYVTYLPDAGDPAIAICRGVEFKANVPTLVKDKDHIASARGSRFFRVGSDVVEENPNKAPQDAMDYRGHVLGWAKGVTTVEELVTRWARDRDLRMRCEVAHDDIQYLGTLIEPRLQKMRMAEGLSETQVAALWIKHGELVIPWKS